MADPRIVALLEDASSMADGLGIVSIVDAIIGLLMVSGLAYSMFLPPRSVGVHTSNRYGVGVIASKIHKLGVSIVRMGWSYAACSLAVCMEDDDSKSFATFTVRMQSGSQLFGKCQDNEIRYGSLSNSHTNQFLVCVTDGAPCSDESISVDGYMNKDKILAKCPSIATALEQGLKWTVLDKKVGMLYPSFPNLVQRARQAVAQQQNVKSKFEVMGQIQMLSTGTMTDDGTPAWDKILRVVLQSEPTCQD